MTGQGPDTSATPTFRLSVNYVDVDVTVTDERGNFVGNLNDNFGVIGYYIIGIFVVSWAVSTIIYKVRRYDDIEVAERRTR